MGFQKFKELEIVYEYDFATDGGSVGNINLRCLGLNALSSDLVIEELQIYVETTFASSGSATVTVGNEDDRDGYLVDIFALATGGAALRSGQVAGALLWDNTNDNELSYKIPDSGAAVPSISVGTAALTAGKAKFVFKCKRFA